MLAQGLVDCNNLLIFAGDKNERESHLNKARIEVQPLPKSLLLLQNKRATNRFIYNKLVLLYF